MLWTLAGRLTVALLLVLVNGFFVASELALVKIRETQLDTLVARRRRGARDALRLKRNLNAAITATQLGVTLAGMALGRYVEPMVEVVAEPLLHALGLPPRHWAYGVLIGAGFVIMSFVLMILGEALPKALAINKTEPVTLMIATPLSWFFQIARPLIRVISGTALWLAQRLGVEPLDEHERHSPEELRLMILSGAKDGAGTELGHDIVLNSLDLRRRVVREVMRPRREITALNTAATLEACLEVAERSRYSRFPLCERGDLDRTPGVVHFKDLVALRNRALTGADLLPAARPVIYVPETARLERVLQLFLERKLHLALVVDEYGGTTGMLTLENILEELVGQIQDEFDHEGPRMSRRGEDGWELAGSLPLFELSELTGTALETDGVTTLNGWVTQRLGRFPRRGDRIAIGGFDLMVEDLEGLRVGRVLLKRLSAAESSETTDVEEQAGTGGESPG
ncbi:MAG: HlyC/CorC family transporter [Verrucomicrobiae bacterium]|nr:HlyC/CorC family transporter [Verrucomicrobiae bacterium]